MIIYTNENNPAALKLLIAGKLGKTALNLKIVNLNDRALGEPRHLPYLEVSEDDVLFIPNAAALYLVNSVMKSTSEWLEWESYHLVPALAHVIGGNSKADSLKSSLINALKKLDKALEQKSFLTRDSFNIDDVVIWATVYPLAVDPNLTKQYLLECNNLQNWLTRMEKIPEVKAALAEYAIGVGAYQALLSGGKFPGPALSAVPDSPSHPSDLITTEEFEAAKQAWVKNVKGVPLLNKGVGTILPKKDGRNVLITSALPYVNNVPHLGNIIGCVLSADVFARFSRVCNYNTLYIGGTDEYGTATETKALEEGLSCQAICDKYYTIHRDIYEWFNISFDYFGRSSSPHQTVLCQEIFLQLNDNGFTFTEAVEQLHCEKCNRYLADRFVEGGCPHPGCNYEDARGDQCDGCGKLVNAVELKNPRCKICKATPKVKTSHQFFVDLPKLEPLLLHWIKSSSPGWSNNAQVIAKSWLKEGLKPRCITRDLKWGVPVPLKEYQDKVFYVWFDAPIGYISMTKAYTDDWAEWWKPKAENKITYYQFMAKDNVPFHSVMFPSCLLGTNKGYTTVSHIMATEYLNYEDGKFSKSRGVGVFGNDARDTGIPSDVWRFYLLYVRPESQDSSFSWADLATKNNSELLNNLGNFINRALVFAKNNFNRIVPEMVLQQDDFTLLALCTRELKSYVGCLEKAKLRDGIRHILNISRHGNQYMQVNQPWVLLKGTPEEKLRAGTIIGLCCNISCLLAILLHPYMPDTSTVLKKQLNAPDFALTPESLEVNQLLPSGHQLGEPSPLFAKLEPAHVEALKQKFAGKNTDVVNGNPVKKEEVKASTDDVKQLEEHISKQGLVVRKLKEGGASKTECQPEVSKLLELKNKLAVLLGTKVDGKSKKKK